MIDYKYAEAITSIILGEEDGNKLADKQLHSLHEIYARAKAYEKKGFLPDLVEAFFVKKAAMLQKAVTVNELKEIMKLNAPRYVAGKVVASGNPYDVEEEELILWSITSLNSPLIDEAYKRYLELFEKFFPKEAELITGNSVNAA